MWRCIRAGNPSIVGIEPVIVAVQANFDVHGTARDDNHFRTLLDCDASIILTRGWSDPSCRYAVVRLRSEGLR
jgi:hypothetical protein